MYFLNHKNSFLFVRFRKTFRKASYSTKESYGSGSNLGFATIATILKSSFLPVFFNLNGAKLKNSRLLLNAKAYVRRDLYVF